MTNALYDLVKKPTLIAVVLTSGIGGTFHYGFHISSVNAPAKFVKELVNKTCIERYGVHLDPWSVSFIMSVIVSIISVGGILGSLCAGWLAHSYGRKKILMLNSITNIIGSILILSSKAAVSFEMVMIGRMIFGFNAGVSLTIHPMYVLECAPKSLRGMIGATVAGFVSLGKFSGQLLGLSELLGTEDRWPWLLAFGSAMNLLQVIILPFLPESPHYLLMDLDDRPGCEKALQRLWGKGTHGAAMEELQLQQAALRGVGSRSVLELFLDRTMRWQLMTVIVITVALQFCGINAVYMYSSSVFRAAGIPAHQLCYVSLGTGLCELTVCLLCAMVIEKIGKRTLLIQGNFMMATILGLLTAALHAQDQAFWVPYCSMGLIFAFVFFFSIGPAGAAVAVPGEIFNQDYKAAAYTIFSFINWATLFCLGMFFPFAIEHLGEFSFIFFLVVCLFSSVFVWLHVPEIKNRTILEITKEFEQLHAGKVALEEGWEEAGHYEEQGTDVTKL